MQQHFVYCADEGVVSQQQTRRGDTEIWAPSVEIYKKKKKKKKNLWLWWKIHRAKAPQHAAIFKLLTAEGARNFAGFPSPLVSVPSQQIQVRELDEWLAVSRWPRRPNQHGDVWMKLRGR